MAVLLALVYLLSMPTLCRAAEDPIVGAIENACGKYCIYQATDNSRDSYFHLKQRIPTRTIYFEEPGCLAAGGSSLARQKTKIKNEIAGLAVTLRDAAFQTDSENLFARSLYQVNGKCIQSTKYPTKGFVVDYYMEKGRVTSAIYVKSIQGCTNDEKPRLKFNFGS